MDEPARDRTSQRSDLLMLTAVTAPCPDCGDQRILVPADDVAASAAGDFCCTSCDAAVFLLLGGGSPLRRRRVRVA